MVPRRIAVFFLAVWLATGPAAAQDDPTQPRVPPRDDGPGITLDDAAERLLTLLRTFLLAIPQYEAPEILPNGDIVIRRKQPKEDSPAPAPDHAPQPPAPGPLPQPLPPGGPQTRPL